MLLDSATIDHLIDTAVGAASARSGDLSAVLDRIPAPIYVTDGDGLVTHYNDACLALAGRVPQPGRDKWCVTWKLFTPDGAPLPHDRCPMAVAIHERRAVRGVEAIAERPDGTRIAFEPYPTPLFDDDGKLIGAVNLLLDLTEQRTPDYLRDQAARCRRLAGAVDDRHLIETLELMAVKYEEQAHRALRAH